jgi:1-deoxyxylulose-5-phosphate synthase
LSQHTYAAEAMAAAVSTTIVGATKPRHLTDAVAALDVRLTDDEISALEEHYTPRQPTYYGTKTGY